MAILETERLLLRKWQLAEDLPLFAAIIKDPRVMEYFPALGDEKSAKEFIESANEHIEKHGFGLFACVLKSTDELLGFVGLNIPSFTAHFTPCVEIGWRLAYHAWGNGYATEAAKAVLKFGFTQCGLDEIVSFTVPANIRSQRVMEKLGMHHDKMENFQHPRLDKDHPLSLHVLYRLKKEQWKGD